MPRAGRGDYYHLKDFAQRTRREAFGEGTAEGQAWLQQFLTAILEQGVAAALDFLHQGRRDLPARRARRQRLLANLAGPSRLTP